VIGTVEPSDLGANIHASIDGTVKSISDRFIEMEA
jgi:hypothetical protein